MTYLALYRAWRPQTFEDVIGQEHITRTLQNALREKRFSHAYLLTGPRGTGKTSTAKIFAKAVNCEMGINEEPCNSCSTCKGITEGTILDVVEIDAASNRGVEEIRDLREKIKFAPTEAKYKIYIIDEVHMLTTEAFNALLKTLEEPPKHVIFILATTEPHKLPLTIISRCQRFDFHRVTTEKMIKLLDKIIKSEGFNVSDGAIELIARQSDGGLRDALSLLDQILSFGGEKIDTEDVLTITGRASNEIFSRMAKGIKEGNTAEVLRITDDLLYQGKEPNTILEDFLYYYRDLLLYKTAPAFDGIKEKAILDPNIPLIAEEYSEQELYQTIETLNKYLNEIKTTNQKRIILDLAIIKTIKSLTSDTTSNITNDEIIQLKNSIKELERKIEQLSSSSLNTNETSSNNSQETSKKQAKSAPTIAKTNNQILGQLKKMKGHFSTEDYQKVLNMWPKVLAAVKEKKITVHAWLIDGEPVAVANGQIVIMFNNSMHRDTTNKPANRELIESVIFEISNKPYNIFNIMHKDWNTFTTENQSEELEIEDKNEDEESNLTKKAIDLFGKELLEIKD